MLIFALVFTIIAFIFYTVAVWETKKTNTINNKQLAFFWLGVILVTISLFFMSQLNMDVQGSMFHKFFGYLSILLMFVHTIFATIVVKFEREDLSKKFYEYSLIFWGLWLIPFISGMMLGMML